MSTPSAIYAPYNEPHDGVGTSQTVYGFTGEPTDANELVYLRARYLNPALGVFSTLDPLGGTIANPMSLNGYSWVEGNVVNATDPSGYQAVGTGDECGHLVGDAYQYSLCRQTVTGNACPPGWISEGGFQQVCYAPTTISNTFDLGYDPALAWDVYWGNQPESVLADINNTSSGGYPTLGDMVVGAGIAFGVTMTFAGAALLAAYPSRSGDNWRWGSWRRWWDCLRRGSLCVGGVGAVWLRPSAASIGNR